VNDAPITRLAARTRLWRAVTSSLISPAQASLVTGSALLTILSFPDFDLWFLAWVSLVPLLIVVARVERPGKAFVAGWLWGTVFFYGTCWWLTYPMIHYGQFRAWLAYPLLILPIAFVGLFPAFACASLSLLIQRFGVTTLVMAPGVWVTFDWLRYLVTGQLWNAIGYSQAFHPSLIQSASWGGVYGISFLMLLLNSAMALLLLSRRPWLPLISTLAVVAILVVTAGVFRMDRRTRRLINAETADAVIAIQPNVPIDLTGDVSEMKALLQRHLELSTRALQQNEGQGSMGNLPRLIVWPESPMNFSYSRDPHLRQVVGEFARANHASILLNSLEPAKDGGDQNSAILVNEKGEMSARYDKIRLMPFGEYVPLPRWLPGASSVRGLVGEFTPGSSYTLMPLGALRAGVFICIEAAHPEVARSFTNQGADVLINISNDGYLGPTPVMRQHLANAVFRAVENDRDLLRVTNSGITAFISSTGAVYDQTTGFHEDVRTWTISKGGGGSTFYSRHGDLFAYASAVISLGIISASFMRRRVV
jgi:apolipoprotein N-acyltransferase